MERPFLRMIGIKEAKEFQLKGTKNIFNKIIEVNFPTLKKDMHIKIQEALQNSRLHKKIPTPHNNLNTKHKE